MSTEQMPTAPMAEVTKKMAAHPLCPITSSEIKRSAELIKSCWPPKTNFHFKAITLEEPAKAELVPYLEAEHKGARLPRIDRRTFVSYYIRNTVREILMVAAFFEVLHAKGAFRINYMKPLSTSPSKRWKAISNLVPTSTLRETMRKSCRLRELRWRTQG